MSTSLVSLNICGLSKLETNSIKREWVLQHDIIALQETLHLPHTLGFEGFTVIEEPARTQQKHGPGRRSGGLAILLANTWLGTADIDVVFRDWFLLAVRISSPTGPALLLVNVYTPLHCDDHPPHLDVVIKARLDSLTGQFPGDATVLCGDWNGDLFRLNSGYDRKFLKIDNALQAVGFLRFPRTRQPFTFRQEKRKSTIDYVYTRGIEVVSEEVVNVHITCHRPIRTVFRSVVSSSDLHLDSALGRAYPRSPNSFNSLEENIGSLALMKVVTIRVAI